MPHLDVHGTSFHYRQLGAGPDVVLLHAVTANLSVWLFSGILDTLASQFRVTAYDLRGHGLTEVTPTGYTSAAMAADYLAIREQLGLGPAYFVGHSFGAVVAMHVAVLAPEQVRGVILSDPYFPGLKDLEPNLHQANVWVELREMFAPLGLSLGEQVDFTHLFALVAQLNPEQIEQLKQATGPGAVRWLAQLPKLSETSCGADVFAEAGLTAEQLSRVQQPVVALYDEHTPFAATRAWLAAHLPNCVVDTVPAAKHIAPLQNATVFVEMVQQHLKRMRAVHTPDAIESSAKPVATHKHL